MALDISVPPWLRRLRPLTYQGAFVRPLLWFPVPAGSIPHIFSVLSAPKEPLVRKSLLSQPNVSP